MSRPNKPIEQHRLHGTFRADRHGPEEHPIDELDGLPEMPADLPDRAKELWRKVVPDLASAKIAIAIDAVELAAMCRWWAKYSELMARAEQEEPYDQESELHQWRLEKRAKAAWAAFDSIACRFGLTPSDRAKLRVSTEGTKVRPTDPLQALGIN